MELIYASKLSLIRVKSEHNSQFPLSRLKRVNS